jgi:hypothetical protein
MLKRGNQARGVGMSDSVTARAAAGVSFLFHAGERPDAAEWRHALGASQTRARMVREDGASGSAELVLDGLTFDVDGLPPAAGVLLGALQSVDADGEPIVQDFEAVQVYPGHHLSGGLGMAPVVRALVALAAGIAVRLPVSAIYWHPAEALVKPQAFAHAAWAWLAGGTFPARVLTALTVLQDGSVASRGLAHFTGQEIMLKPRQGESAEQALRIAEQVVAYLVAHGRVAAISDVIVGGELVCIEPAQRGAEVWVWRKAD